MALFASFGRSQSLAKNQFVSSFENSENLCEVDQFGPNFFYQNTMKRKRVPDESDQPGSKRRHYEERMAYKLNSLDLSSEDQPETKEDSSDELYIREIDPEDLDDSPIYDVDEDSQQPIVEEPEEEENSEEFVLSEELRQIMNAAKKEKFLPKFIPSAGRELVLWRPPVSPIPNSPDDSEENPINNRIHEVPEDIELTEFPTDTVSAPMEDTSQVTFPEDSSSSRSSISPPLNVLNSSIDGRLGCQSPSSSSSSDGNLAFRLRQTSNVPTSVFQTADDEPMDLD